MFVPTKATVKLANGNMGNTQVIGIILCRFPKFSIIYLVGPVYYCPGHPSNTISSGALNFYIGGFTIQMDFAFFNVEIIHGFTSTFLAIFSATSYQFGLPSRSKRPPLDILKFPVTALRNQDKKFAFIRVDENGALARSSKYTKTCHNMNIIVQTTGGDEYSFNGKN